MRFTISRKDLAAELSAAEEFTGKKHIVPLSSSVQLKCEAGTLTIFFGGAISTSKTIYMLEGENGLTGKVLSTGAEVANASKPAAEIAKWDALVYTLEANKTYKFSVDATKWRLAALRYALGATGISAVRNAQSADGAIYNLQGIRVSNPTKGLYIQNGKKTVMK